MDLPKALDDVLKALLNGHSISSWKVAADGQNPTVILRLQPLRVPNVPQDGVRVDNTVAFRRKPPSQINRDRRRMNDFKLRNDRVVNHIVHVSEEAQSAKDEASKTCDNHRDKCDIECTVMPKVSDTVNHVDNETRSLDCVASAGDTGVTPAGATAGEVSVTPAAAESGTAMQPTCTESPARVLVSKEDTVIEVAGSTRADPGVDRAHGERREDRGDQDNERCKEGKGVEREVSIDKCSDSSEWVDISKWHDYSYSPRNRWKIKEGDRMKEDIGRRSKRLEGKDVKYK